MRKIKVLFYHFGIVQDKNAQSLISREIALRLDPTKFDCTFFYRGTADPRLVSAGHITLKWIPPRGGSIFMGYHLILGKFDILVYPPVGKMLDLYSSLVSVFGREKKIIKSFEMVSESSQTYSKADIALITDASFCYAISPFIAESVKQTLGIEVSVLPLGVDSSRFHFVNRPQNSKPVQIIDVATIQSRKQTHVVLDLANKIGADLAEFHIVGDLIGPVEYRDELLRRKTDEGLNHVHFHGKVVHAELPKWLNRSDILILPSRLEGLPKITLEAAATGLPCVIFDDYRTPSVVDGVTGFQVNTFDQFYSRLVLLIENPNLRQEMGRAATAHVQQFDWDNVIEQYEEMLLDVDAHD